jgi:hypothetical protein
VEDTEMELKQLRVSKKPLVLLLIGLLLCTNTALGSTVDIKVTRGGSPVPGVTVYIDDNNVGTTDSNGQRSNINVSPGFHIARAEGVSREFNVQFDGYAWVEIPI